MNRSCTPATPDQIPEVRATFASISCREPLPASRGWNVTAWSTRRSRAFSRSAFTLWPSRPRRRARNTDPTLSLIHASAPELTCQELKNLRVRHVARDKGPPDAANEDESELPALRFLILLHDGEQSLC